MKVRSGRTFLCPTGQETGFNPSSPMPKHCSTSERNSRILRGSRPCCRDRTDRRRDMANSSLLSKVAGGDSEQVELRVGPDHAAIGRSICAFLNTRGGLLIIGIDPQGEVT